CKAERTPITVDAIDPTYLTESTFLNKLQSEVNGWVKKIQKVTQLEQDPATVTASQEINFWLNMEKSLEAIERQVKSEEVTFTMELLNTAKRFHVTTSFYADTRLKEATEK
ncbi:5195_t:CDS:1, partial [Paraglomus occultum]